MSLEFWKNSSPLFRRLITIIIIFIFSIIITAAGTLTPIEEQEANEISNELNQTMDSLIANGVLLQYIFGNNFMLALLMFIPIIGIILGAYVLYSTGVVIGAIAISNQFPPILSLVALFLTPVAWLEFIAYSIAMAESIWLTRRLWQHRGKHELVNATKFIAICAVILLVAAAVETLMIYSAS